MVKETQRNKKKTKKKEKAEEGGATKQTTVREIASRWTTACGCPAPGLSKTPEKMRILK